MNTKHQSLNILCTNKRNLFMVYGQVYITSLSFCITCTSVVLKTKKLCYFTSYLFITPGNIAHFVEKFSC